MDKTLIYQAIENPALRKEISIEELEKIQQSYPYFSTAQVLLAKMYQEKNDHRFADQLQQAALYSNNRQVLYEYIKDTQFSILNSEKEEDSQFSILNSENNDIQELEDFEMRISNFESRIANLESTIENRELRIENSEHTVPAEETAEQNFESRIASLESSLENRELRIENSEQTVPVEDMVEQHSEVVRAKDLDPMEANFIIEAVHSTIELEAEEEKGYGEADRGYGEAEERTEEKGEAEKRTEEKGEEDRGYGEAEERTEEKGEEERGPVTYAEYMMAKAKRMQGGEERGYGEAEKRTEEKRTEEKGEAEERTEDRGYGEAEQRTEDRGYGEAEKGEGEAEVGGLESFEDRISNFESSARRIQKPSLVEVQKSIIDKFIQQQPKITPGKAAEYTNTQNLGKDSLEEDMTFVTETMAKLYAAQGKIDKAKKVYRQLIALHPEKSIYFAAQLKNLNQNKKI